MNFGFDSIILWSKSGACRSLEFKRNCVNILTGGSHTGKSALLDIIDYCFLASTHKLPDSIINENVAWYGLTFYINDKTYTIARKSPIDNSVSKDYYFSSIGIAPEVPLSNIKEDDLKSILEVEFHIDDKVTVAYGGRALKAGSKVSFRYFFLFNTVSEDIITNSKIFFDKQSEERYQEALPRIFDMALGIDDLSNIAAREKKELLKKEKLRAQRKESRLSQERAIFDEEMRGIAAKAAEYGLMDSVSADTFSVESLRKAISDAAAPQTVSTMDQYAETNARLLTIDRRLRKLRQFTAEYRSYKETLKNAEDSLRPIEQLLKQSPTIVKSEIFDDLISSLKIDLLAIKKSIVGKHPVDGQISRMVKTLEEERDKLRHELATMPEELKSFASEREKWMFIGEAIWKLKTCQDATPTVLHIQTPSLDDLQQEIDAIEVRDVDETREAVVSLINEIALYLLKETGDALANYASYQTDFNYKEKRLRLRKPRSKLIENVGSSSNHMFLHLLHFLAIHEVAISYKSVFIPNFLILDQPSRPYYPDEKADDNVKLTNSDREKVSIAFNLLNNFVARMNQDYKTPFQMIVFEHVPKDTFAGMDYVHLLPEFRNGDALIPQSWLSS